MTDYSKINDLQFTLYSNDLSNLINVNIQSAKYKNEMIIYDHLLLFQIKAYDQVITCSYISHGNVLAGKIVT